MKILLSRFPHPEAAQTVGENQLPKMRDTYLYKTACAGCQAPEKSLRRRLSPSLYDDHGMPALRYFARPTSVHLPFL